MSRLIDRRHRERRDFLRVVGPVIVGIGLVFTIIGFGGFFSAFGSHSFEGMRYFWCAFVGIPLIGFGTAITKFAFMGAVSRYLANEVAPVGKDLANYMVAGTKDAVREMASVVGEGLRGDPPAKLNQARFCPECNADNDANANFCKTCGSPLAKTKACTRCGELNDIDARFCDNCGVSCSAE